VIAWQEPARPDGPSYQSFLDGLDSIFRLPRVQASVVSSHLTLKIV